MTKRNPSPTGKRSAGKERPVRPEREVTTVPELEDLLRRSRPELIEHARRIGLKGVNRLTKAELAAQIQEAGRPLSVSSEESKPANTHHKFDLGFAPGEPREQAQDIPWSYGQDRVTTMSVDPERLYVYWEVTDEAIERARAALGSGGSDAWLNLRVYDVTNRIFDGTNAHAYFDHSVSRTDRQWFFFLGRPTSTAVAEVGLKSSEGYFVRIARSGRADFPRRESASPGGVEWLTVWSASGEVGAPTFESREVPAIFGGAPPSGQAEPVRVWDIRRTHAGGNGEWMFRDESFGGTWQEWGEWARTIAWEGPVVRTTWESGPFTYPVAPPSYVEERYEGPVTVRSVNGTTHIVHGAKQVVIRGIGARAERRVLAVWEIHHSWPTQEGVAVRQAGEATVPRGGSERLAGGASEVRWSAASELRLGGASELYLLGASELRYLGASELFSSGASEWRARGASEVRYVGASEWRERGASEWSYAGASERLRGGASERVWPGASEHRPRFPDGPSAER
jgi:hypothetical protein